MSNETVRFSNSPNPFKESINLDFYLRDEADATIECYDLSGKMVKTILNDTHLTAGNHKIDWDGKMRIMSPLIKECTLLM
jgi:flagellar hook assembly protein FlgD